jgi:hypothetical protein
LIASSTATADCAVGHSLKGLILYVAEGVLRPRLRIDLSVRKLEDTVEKNSEGKIVSRRKKEVTNVRQLGCEWSALCSFKDK